MLLVLSALIAPASAIELSIDADTCPGPATIEVTGATPGGTVAFLSGLGPADDGIGIGPCAGTVTGLFGPLLLTRMTDLDGDGAWSFAPSLPGGVCSRWIQVVDMATCETSAAMPTFVDSDGDGVSDGADVCPGGDDLLDSDDNGIPDACDTDWIPSGDHWMLSKDDGTWFEGTDCDGNFFGADETVVEGVPFRVGPYFPGTMAGVVHGGRVLEPPIIGGIVNHLYMLVPGGRCSAQGYTVTFLYADGSSAATGTLSVPHDCDGSSPSPVANARGINQGTYSPNACCNHWHWLEFTNPDPAMPVSDWDVYYLDGCGGAYNGQIWAVSAD